MPPRRVPVLARQAPGRKVHWVPVDEPQPGVGSPLPAGSRTLCGRHYHAEGWVVVSPRTVTSAEMCYGCS